MIDVQVRVRRSCSSCQRGRVENPRWAQFWEGRRQSVPEETELLEHFGVADLRELPPDEVDCQACDGEGWRYAWMPLADLLSPPRPRPLLIGFPEPSPAMKLRLEHEAEHRFEPGTVRRQLLVAIESDVTPGEGGTVRELLEEHSIERPDVAQPLAELVIKLLRGGYEPRSAKALVGTVIQQPAGHRNGLFEPLADALLRGDADG